jgi:hypothetical protein
LLDSTLKGCREKCNDTTYFDYTLKKCVSCKVGYWLNSSSGMCSPCPSGCYSCNKSAVGSPIPDCQSCLPGLVFEQFTCRKACKPNQFYDWSAADCRNCSYPCTKCSGYDACMACDEMFNYNTTDGSCSYKCVPGYTMWNNFTKTCESSRNITVVAQSSAQRTMRCRSVLV